MSDETIRAIKALVKSGPTDALDTGFNLGLGAAVTAIEALPASDLLDERNLNRALQRENVIYDGFVTIGERGGLHPFGSWSSNLHGAWVTVCIRYEPKP